jgi:hypothetical protein
MRLKLRYDQRLSNFASNYNLQRYIKVKMSPATGAMGIECGPTGKLYSTLASTAAVKIGNVQLKEAEIKLYVQVGPATECLSNLTLR